MKKLVLTMASLVMLASMAFAQETPMLPESHGLTDNQPAWGGSQEFSLNAGWNWWSTFIIGQSVEDLENALGENAVIIKSSGPSVVYTDGAWQGLLAGTIENNQMYAIQMNEPLEFRLRGSRAAADNVAISGVNGWSWVGYPVNSQMTVAYALQNYQAQDGDMFKSDGPFATFDGANNVWVGSLAGEGQYLQPGYGYKLYSQNDFTFYYPVLPQESRGITPSQQVVATEWQAQRASNPDNMNMIAVVSFDGEELRSDNVEIGAFDGDICRGVIRPMYVESRDRYIVFLTMYGENGEPFSFRLLDESGDVYESNEASVKYQADAIVGSLNTPFELKFNTKKSMAGNLKLFPNPVNRGEMVNLTLPADGTVEVINVLGSTMKRVRMAEGSQLAADMAPGIYTIKVTDAEGNVYVDKLVVK